MVGGCFAEKLNILIFNRTLHSPGCGEGEHIVWEEEDEGEEDDSIARMRGSCGRRGRPSRFGR